METGIWSGSCLALPGFYYNALLIDIIYIFSPMFIEQVCVCGLIEAELIAAVGNSNGTNDTAARQVFSGSQKTAKEGTSIFVRGREGGSH